MDEYPQEFCSHSARLLMRDCGWGIAACETDIYRGSNPDRIMYSSLKGRNLSINTLMGNAGEEAGGRESNLSEEDIQQNPRISAISPNLCLLSYNQLSTTTSLQEAVSLPSASCSVDFLCFQIALQLVVAPPFSVSWASPPDYPCVTIQTAACFGPPHSLIFNSAPLWCLDLSTEQCIFQTATNPKPFGNLSSVTCGERFWVPFGGHKRGYVCVCESGYLDLFFF